MVRAFLPAPEEQAASLAALRSYEDEEALRTNDKHKLGKAWGWAAPYDDRKNELVLIGVGLDKEAITRELEAALLTPTEEQEAAASAAASGTGVFEALRDATNPFAEILQEVAERLLVAERDPEVKEGMARLTKSALAQASGFYFAQKQAKTWI